MDDVVHTGGGSRTDYQRLIVSEDRFQLLQGGEFLTDYRFNTGAAQHLFCKVCGIKSFYVPRSHPDGIRPFDGRNWEESTKGKTW